MAPEHFPLPCSLRKLVLDLYTPDQRVGSGQSLERSALLDYLNSADTSSSGPLEAVMVQIEARGDPTRPSEEQVALLDWLYAAYMYWEQQFPIEQPLASELRKLLPLLAALAITDEEFLTPGAHSMHQLLDAIQSSAMGWQARLGRAGQNLEREIGDTVAKAGGWFAQDSVNLAAIKENLVTAIGKDRGRAQRMAQRAVEAEQGQMKTALAKNQAATMINALLSTHTAPASIGEFLKGPWHDSAQLVLLRFGEESKQWASMSATTRALLDSLQTGETEATEEEAAQSGSRRQQLFEAITRLPRELRRWLVSLQHDSQGVEEAIGIVEVAHMSVLRQQDLNAQAIAPIRVEQALSETDDPQIKKSIGQLEIGRWFLYLEGKNDPLRVQLMLKIEAGQQLFFTNQAGLKAMRKSYSSFAHELSDKRAIPLHGTVSFSRSLAHAAKLSSQADLNALSTGGAPQATVEDKASIRRNRERDETARLQLQREQEEEEQLRREFDHAVQMQSERETAVAAASEEPQIQGVLQEDDSLQQHEDEVQAQDEIVPSVPPTPSAPMPAEAFWLKLSMGSWLGFHDGDKPLLAKLAAHDREHDRYIFVNRKGIKMRDLSKGELNALMNKGQVEILETRSNFREEDEHVRNTYKD